MELNTILQILYANRLDHVISLAIQIDNKIPLNRKEGDIVGLEISRNQLPDNKTFQKDVSWGIVNVTILGINIYSIETPYMVKLPNDKIEWVGEGRIKNSIPVEIIDKLIV